MRRIYPKIVGVCKLCNSDIIAKNNSNSKNRVFCSHSCSSKYAHKHKLIDKKINLPVRICKICGDVKQISYTHIFHIRNGNVNSICLSCATTGIRSPRWVKDRSKLKKYNDSNLDRRSSAYRYWRQQVWLRDNFKCKLANPNCSGRLEAHHILGYTDHPELRYDVNNGITLCHAHHPRKRAEEKRLIPYFTELVSVSKG